MNPKIRNIQRFLLFQAFLIWQGGFLFYSAVVVPTGTDLLGSAYAQGKITQVVTNWLNLIGVGWHLIAGWELFTTTDPRRRRKVWRQRLWLTSCVFLTLLVVIHIPLDKLLAEHEDAVIGLVPFRLWHVLYLWISTFQWIAMLIYAWHTLRLWQDAPVASQS